MSDIEDLESRLTAAMQRIGRGLDGLQPTQPPADDSELEALRGALDNERDANAQLEERVRSLHERQGELETELDGLRKTSEQGQAELETARGEAEAARAELTALKEAAETAAQAPKVDMQNDRDALAQMAFRLRRLRRSSRALRESNQKLRDAAQSETVDPDLINQSLAAELEELKLLREAEQTEVDAILGALRPILAATQSKPEENAHMEDG